MNPLFDPAALAALRAPATGDEPAAPAVSAPVAGILRTLEAAATAGDGQQSKAADRVVDLGLLTAADRTSLEEALGRGEVSIRVDGPRPAAIDETGLVGIWRVEDAGGVSLEVGDVPAVVRAAVAAQPAGFALPSPDGLPADAMNAIPLLREIAEHLAGPGDGPAHQINLTLMPVSAGDMAVLAETLGAGPVDILARGYGSCRIRATAIRGVWDVRHSNSEGKVILHALEIGDVPVAALATAEDLTDSVRRLRTLLAG